MFEATQGFLGLGVADGGGDGHVPHAEGAGDVGDLAQVRLRCVVQGAGQDRIPGNLGHNAARV